MTAYFDAWDARCMTLRREWEADNGRMTSEMQNAFEAIEHDLVYDVTLAAESPGFPADLRQQVHRVVLLHAVHMRPVNASTNGRIEEVEDLFRELAAMSNKLHTIFHDLVVRNIPRFSDDPRAPMRALYADGEAYREVLAQPSEEVEGGDG